MDDFLFLTKEIWSGKSAIRSTLNRRLFQECLAGRILDIGSGGSDRYSSTIPQAEGAVYELFDVKKGQAVDFETDRLPYEDGTYDTILLTNVLEHIYNHKHLLREIHRIKKDEGVVIGYVPFLMWFHPDHHDYYRYTHQALERIFAETGYTDVQVEPIYRGPFTAAFQMIHTTIPVFLRPVFFTPAYLLDRVFSWLRPNAASRYALGYYFVIK